MQGISSIVMDIGLELPTSHKHRVDDIGLTTTTDTEPNNGEGIISTALMNKCEPIKGLEFETKEEAYTYYREYASSVGFGITIKASRRSKKSGRFIDVKIACSRFGTNKRSNNDDVINSKTDCKAGMHVKRRPDDGKWFIYCFVKEHNHEFPDLNPIKQFSTASQNKSGFQLALDDDGDFESLFDNFMVIQSENPGFFYAVDLGNEKRMRNVFWIDAKARRDYINFGDVICFHTLNKKTLIFGVNHHCQYILFGCAVLGEDTAYSNFVWLFRTWLRAVGGQTPRVIITNNDENYNNNNTLNEAIAEVFPDARHCFSLWHVLRKIQENLPPRALNASNFNAKFEKYVYRSWTEDEFEKRWWKMMDRFELREIDWVQCLYENRKKWVPTYMKNICLSGLCTTTEDSYLLSFYKKLIKNGENSTNMKEFMDNYRLFLHENNEEEAKADDYEEQPTLRSVSPFEKQMSTVYTRAIFEKFQVEVLGIISCNILQKECCRENVVDETLRFRVNDLEKQENFIVQWDVTNSDISCLCRLFEYRGFLCRHAMVVLEMRGFNRIPSRYILKRWTKIAEELNNTVKMMMSSSNRIQRFNNLCKLAVRLGGEGSLSQETYSIALYEIEQALKHCVGVNRNLKFEEENRKSYQVEKKKKKKPQKKQKVQSETESISVRVQERSQQMEMLDQRAAETFDTCPYVPQQENNMQEMDMGSRTTANLDGYYLLPQQSIQPPAELSLLSSGRDGYYSNQQIIQPLGQWNSTPTRIGHYVPQQTLQELLQGQLNFRAPTMDGGFHIQDGLQQEEDEVEDMEQSANVTSKHLHDKHLPR